MYEFRIAANKMSVRLDAQNVHFIEVGKLLSADLNQSIGPKLIEVSSFFLSIDQCSLQEIDKIFVEGQQKNTLVVLDSLQLVAGDDLNDEISLLLDIQKRLSLAESLIAFGTCRETSDYGFRIPLQITVNPIGSGFGKKVGGQVSRHFC